MTDLLTKTASFVWVTSQLLSYEKWLCALLDRSVELTSEDESWLLAGWGEVMVGMLDHPEWDVEALEALETLHFKVVEYVRTDKNASWIGIDRVVRETFRSSLRRLTVRVVGWAGIVNDATIDDGSAAGDEWTQLPAQSLSLG